MSEKEIDLRLIESVLNGCTSDYAQLVKRHQRFVFTLALRFVKNREDAEEIAQDSFVKAYKALATFKQDSKFTTWMYTITYTTAMTFLRKRQLLTASIDDEEQVFQLPNTNSNFAADKVEKKSTYAYLNQAIDSLQPDDAAIITLFYKGEQHLEEIAAVLNMEPNTVKVKLHRARQRLKDKLHVLLGEEIKELI
ncbi:ECF RNA polymerase sigma-E factor [compost metagenome]